MAGEEGNNSYDEMMFQQAMSAGSGRRDINQQETNSDMLKELLRNPMLTEEGNYPKFIRDMAVFFEVNGSLTNLSDEEVNDAYFDFLEMKYIYLKSISKSEYTFEEKYYWRLIEQWYENNVHRAKQGFERQMQISQFSKVEYGNSGMQRQGQGNSGGIWNTIKGYLR